MLLRVGDAIAHEPVILDSGIRRNDESGSAKVQWQSQLPSAFNFPWFAIPRYRYHSKLTGMTHVYDPMRRIV